MDIILIKKSTLVTIYDFFFCFIRETLLLGTMGMWIELPP